jgi:hypothetical protein
LIREKKDDYLRAGRNTVKAELAEAVIDEIQKRSGRFLRKATKAEAQQVGMSAEKRGWVVVQDKTTILSKIKQAMRDTNRETSDVNDDAAAAPAAVRTGTVPSYSGLDSSRDPIVLLSNPQHQYLLQEPPPPPQRDPLLDASSNLLLSHQAARSSVDLQYLLLREHQARRTAAASSPSWSIPPGIGALEQQLHLQQQQRQRDTVLLMSLQENQRLRAWQDQQLWIAELRQQQQQQQQQRGAYLDPVGALRTRLLASASSAGVSLDADSGTRGLGLLLGSTNRNTAPIPQLLSNATYQQLVQVSGLAAPSSANYAAIRPSGLPASSPLLASAAREANQVLDPESLLAQVAAAERRGVNHLLDPESLLAQVAAAERRIRSGNLASSALQYNTRIQASSVKSPKMGMNKNASNRTKSPW